MWHGTRYTRWKTMNAKHLSFGTKVICFLASTKTTITLIIMNSEYNRWLMTLSIILKICIKIIIYSPTFLSPMRASIYWTYTIGKTGVEFILMSMAGLCLVSLYHFFGFVVYCIEKSNVVTLKSHKSAKELCSIYMNKSTLVSLLPFVN